MVAEQIQLKLEVEKILDEQIERLEKTAEGCRLLGFDVLRNRLDGSAHWLKIAKDKLNKIEVCIDG